MVCLHLVCFGVSFCSIDPGNTRARHGMYRLEKRTDVGLDTTYDMDVDDASTSENEVSVTKKNDQLCMCLAKHTFSCSESIRNASCEVTSRSLATVK